MMVFCGYNCWLINPLSLSLPIEGEQFFMVGLPIREFVSYLLLVVLGRVIDGGI